MSWPWLELAPRLRSRGPVPQSGSALLQTWQRATGGDVLDAAWTLGVPVTSRRLHGAVVLEYGNELYREVCAQGVVGEGDPCPVLCVLLHNGRWPWTAPTSAAATLSMPAARGRAVVPPGLVAFHPWGYFPRDFVAQRDRPHIPGDIISMMVGIEFARVRADLVAPLWDTVRPCARTCSLNRKTPRIASDATYAFRSRARARLWVHRGQNPRRSSRPR